MLLAVNADLLNPLIPKAHISECQNPLFPLHKLSQWKSIKAKFAHILL